MQQIQPSLKALRAFEVAARYLSFKEASQELHVTPAAISQQIRVLEEYFSQPLFLRRCRSLALTDAGRFLLPELTKGFESITRGVQRMQERGAGSVLKVASAPAFSAKWLVPNLERFSHAHTGCDVYVIAAHELVDYEQAGIDIGIRYGLGHYPGLVSDRLLSDAVFPVCSPHLPRAGMTLSTPANLSRQILLHDDSLLHDDHFPNWGAWLEAAGVSDVDARRGPRFNVAADAISAAIQGAGVLLARQSLVGSELASGELVRLFDIEFPLETGFYVVYPKRLIKQPKVRAFRDWLLEELTDTKLIGDPAIFNRGNR